MQADRNTEHRRPSRRAPAVQDETLREGLQAPAVREPGFETKLEFLKRLVGIGVSSASIGMPASNPRAREHAIALAKHGPSTLELNAAARMTECDLRAVLPASEASGRTIYAYAFVGASPLRRLVEGWSSASVLDSVAKALRFAERESIPVCLVTEDTVRTDPTLLASLFRLALDHGVRRLCLCDTVGHATPSSAKALVSWVRELAGPAIELDWHGHNDRGLALANALGAVEAGVDRVHGTVLGLGERSGHVAMEQLLANLQLSGRWDVSLDPLVSLARFCADAFGVSIPPNAPVVGRDAFRTVSGVHAAAVSKAMNFGVKQADAVYSSVSATGLGRAQEIAVGPSSGASNVRHWLAAQGEVADEAVVSALLRRAKAARRVLHDNELRAWLAELRSDSLSPV